MKDSLILFLKKIFPFMKEIKIEVERKRAWKYYKLSRLSKELGVHKKTIVELIGEFREKKRVSKKEMYIARMGKQLFLVTTPKLYRSFLKFARKRVGGSHGRWVIR